MTGDYKEQLEAIIRAQIEIGAMRKLKKLKKHEGEPITNGLISALETIERVEKKIEPTLAAIYEAAHRNREFCTCCDTIVKVIEDAGLAKPKKE
jgi:uncharacterized protein YicC (UPF0701 family)